MHDDHVGLQPVGARALNLPVDIDDGRWRHEDLVAVLELDIRGQVAAAIHAAHVDFPPRSRAVAPEQHGDGVAAGRSDPAGERQHVGQSGAGVVERIASGAKDLAEHRYLPAPHLGHGDVHLRIEHEVAPLEPFGDDGRRARRRVAIERNLADQRKQDRALLRNARLRREIRVLEHRNPDGVAGAERLA